MLKQCLITKQYTENGCNHQLCNSADHHVKQVLEFNVKAVNEQDFTIDGTFSTGMEDRMGEVVDQNGWDLAEYLKNPVVLFGHRDDMPAVGQMIAIGIDEQGNLAGTIKFAVKEYDFAGVIFRLYAGRYMRAFSAGFENTDYEVDSENQRLILRKNKLFEVSCVNIPANALALAKSKGLDTSALEKKILSDAEHDIELVKKEGRVLSKKSRTLIENAANALQELLQADAEKEKSISADTTDKTKRSETPVAQGGVKTSKLKLYKGKESVHKALRALLKVKADLK